MTDIEIIIAVAKLDGFAPPSGNERWNYNNQFAPYSISVDDLSGCKRWIDKPYLHSRDAIIPVIEKQDATTKTHLIYGIHHQVNIVDENEPWHTDDIVSILLATPRRLCIALLEATKKWKE